MNGAKLTAADTVLDSPTVNLLLNESLRVMAGGLIQGKWINISAGDIEVEGSGNINAEERGYAARSGPGISSGRLTVVVMFIICSSFVCSVVILWRFSITAPSLYSQGNLSNFRLVYFSIKIRFRQKTSGS